MGAILAVLGQRGDVKVREALGAMCRRTPSRGALTCILDDGAGLAIQAVIGDASLAKRGHILAGVHGYFSDGTLSESSRRLGESALSAAEALADEYLRLGTSVFAHLRGDYSAVILDITQRTLFAATNHVASRPLFHACTGRRHFVATEIRQAIAGSNLTACLDEDSLVDYLLPRAPASEATLYRGVRRLRRAAYHEFKDPQVCAEPSRTSSWSPPAEMEPAAAPVFDELALDLHAALSASVCRAIPGVPFAVALSGGLDSAGLWALLSELAQEGRPGAKHARAYSMVFPGLPCDESSFIQRIVKRAPLDGIRFIDASGISARDYLFQILESVDSLSGYSLFHAALLAKHVRIDKRRVLWTGIGGDEWLYGSLSYAISCVSERRLAQLLREAPILEILRRPDRLRFFATQILRPGIGASVPSRLRAVLRPGSTVASGLAPEWLHPSRHDQAAQRQAAISGAPLSPGRAELIREIDGLHLVKVTESLEQFANACGVEVRSPFMDAEVVNFAFRCPGALIARGGTSKALLRRALRPYVEPSVARRAFKTGFEAALHREMPWRDSPAPPSRWILAERRIVLPGPVSAILARSEAGCVDSSCVLSALIHAELFARRFSL